MPGFFVCNKTTRFTLKDKYPENDISGSINYPEGYTVLRNTLNKFMDDKAFCRYGDHVCILDGMLLNKKALYTKYKTDTVPSLMKIMYEKLGETFFSEFRGAFTGAMYIAEKNRWIVFTNQTGEAPLFYICTGGVFAFASQVRYLTDMCKELNIKLTFDECCAYQMLTYAFVPADNTYAREIKRLDAGCYLVIENNMIQKKQYHRFKRDTIKLSGCSENEIVELIDSTFRAAVKREWDKDDEYGYRHIADMSGGLDSRMNVWVAHKLKSRHIQLLTFCKGGYLDEKIAKDIARYWKDEIIVKQLDDASFMYDIDDITEHLSGLSLYCGITGGKSLVEMINWKRFGVHHTGMIGDAVLGSFYKSAADVAKRGFSGMYSEKLKDRILPQLEDFISGFEDHEIFLLYSRALHGAANTHLIRRSFSETASPFMDVDFLELCFSIPIELRADHYIYKKWIMSKYPNAARFKWEAINGKITENPALLKTRELASRTDRKLTKIITQGKIQNNNGMNPLDYWLSRSRKLRSFMDSYESQGYKYLPASASDKLVNDMHRLYQNGNAFEKSMVVTVLSAARLYFGDNK